MSVNLIVFFTSVVVLCIGFLVFFKKGAVFKAAGFVLILASLGGGVKSTVFQVEEGELIVLTQFKKITTTYTGAGLHFRFPWMEVYSFPKRIISITDTIQGRSLDGLIVEFEITPFIRVDETHLEDIYRNIARSYSDMEEKIVVPAIRNITRSTISGFNAADIYGKRKEFEARLQNDAREYLKNRYVILDELQLRKITLPETIEKAIQLKLQKQQEAEAIDFDKVKAEKQAEVREIEAKGLSTYQSIVNKTLSDKYLQLEAIKAYTELAKSPNKTFIIAPTNPKSTGIPLILGPEK